MRLLAVSEYWFPPVGQGLDAPSALLSAVAHQGHEVHLLSAKAMLEDGEVPQGLTLEFWPGLYAGHEREIRCFVDWAKRKQAELSKPCDAVVSFSPWIAAPTMVLGYPSAAQANRNVGPTRGARDRLMKWLLGTWHPRYGFLRRLEADAVRDPIVRQRIVSDESTRQAWQRVLGLSNDGWRLLPIASTGPRLTSDDRTAARRRVRQSFGIGDGTLVLVAWVHQPKPSETGPLLTAFAQAADSSTKAVLMLAGEVGYAQQKQAADLGIRGKVRFVGWTARTSDLWAASDVVIQLWPCDGRSGPAIEALGLGVPAIAPSSDRIVQQAIAESGDQALTAAVRLHDATVSSLHSAMRWMMAEPHRRQATKLAEQAAGRLSIDRQASELISWLSASAKQNQIKFV